MLLSANVVHNLDRAWHGRDLPGGRALSLRYRTATRIPFPRLGEGVRERAYRAPCAGLL